MKVKIVGTCKRGPLFLYGLGIWGPGLETIKQAEPAACPDTDCNGPLLFYIVRKCIELLLSLAIIQQFILFESYQS